MLIDPYSLERDWDRLEQIEKASLRLVAQAAFDFKEQAAEIFRNESDDVKDMGEDLTREALDRMGVSRVDQRLYGNIDYKRARYVFHPEYALKQALFVDSKAEKISGHGTATLQTSQLSMTVMQVRSGQEYKVPGKLPPVLMVNNEPYLTTTQFVKYNYKSEAGRNDLVSITVMALPNGYLQERYNPTVHDTIFIAGRNAQSRGEEFRVRLSFNRLKEKMRWRVQHIKMSDAVLDWAE